MKNVTIIIEFEEEKMKALKKYIGKKNSSYEKELVLFTDKLYKKYVPLPVREYIEESNNLVTEDNKKGKHI